MEICLCLIIPNVCEKTKEKQKLTYQLSQLCGHTGVSVWVECLNTRWESLWRLVWVLIEVEWRWWMTSLLRDCHDSSEKLNTFRHYIRTCEPSCQGNKNNISRKAKWIWKLATILKILEFIMKCKCKCE